MRAILYLWAAPASVLGLVCAIAACVSGARLRIVNGAVEVAGGGIAGFVGRLPRWMQFHAITLGHVILAGDDDLLAACRAHEHVHVRQYERWGLLFFPLYFGSSFAQLVRGRDPYRDNRFEREAYRLSALDC